MCRNLVSSVALLFLCTACALAADVYPVPPHPASTVKKCAVTFDTGSPSTVKGQFMGWTVTGACKYNYDNTWTFKQLVISTTYTKGGMTSNGPSSTIMSEGGVAAPGSYSVTFNNIRAPVAGEVLTIRAEITIQKAGQADQKESESKPVPAP